MMIQPNTLPELDFQLLDRELDITKTRVFLGKNAAFLGRIQSSLHFQWDASVPTACTNGIYLKWNPYYFHFLTKEGRDSILVHELWHPGLMHILRRGDRDPKIWNYACDTVLDNMMDLDGYCVDGDILFPKELFPTGCKSFVDHVKYGTKSAEEIYDIMIQDMPPPPPYYGGGSGDMIEPTGAEQHTVVNTVVSAVHSAKLSGEAGKLPGSIEVTLNKFLSPKLPWRQILHNFFNELDNKDYTWARPNRRYSSMYLPSLMDDNEGLEHILYFEDVSGSISDGDSIRFNSEFKYVKDKFQPDKMTMAQFDTKIQKVDVFLKDDPFDEVKIVGRGGTCLKCVRDFIIEQQPTAVIIFSDMRCAPMEALPKHMNVPIIWVALNARDVKVNQGQVIHLRE